MTSGPKNTNRLGYTLLEVILASMLAAVVMLIIATSIEIQLRAFKAGRSNVEEAQLARVLLHRIGDDLRALMPAEEVAVANEDAASEESSESKKSESDSDTDSGLADDEDDDSGALDDETTAGESNLGGATPGVYGELDKLRIDVVRAKRPADSASEELPSDADTSSVAMSQNSGGIKTIVYYVLSPEETGVGSVSTDSDQSAGGLVRRQLVGPTAAWAAENGLLEYHDTTITPIAPEVTAVEFRYHDGQEWLESWDSSASGQLPKAFEIRLFFARPAPFEANSSQANYAVLSNQDEQPMTQYRLVVPVMIGDVNADVDDELLNETSGASKSSESSEKSSSKDDTASKDETAKSDSSGGER